MSRGSYTPTGSTYVRRDFWHYGAIPEGYDVYIEVRDLRSERDNGYVWSAGYHKVVIVGPQPHPRSKAFKGETAWSDADRYASDAVQSLQMSDR